MWTTHSDFLLNNGEKTCPQKDVAASPGHLIFISQTFRQIQNTMYKTTKNNFTLLQKCTNRSTRFQEAVDIFVMTDALTWSVRAQIQKSKIFGSGTHEVTVHHYSSTTLYISFDISPERAFCSQCFCVSATCWSSRLCFYSLWHHAACPSDGLVLLCLPASLSSSACWCKR